MNAWDIEGLRIAQHQYHGARRALHERIMLAHQNGMSLRTIAEHLDVSHQTVANIIQRHKRDTGLA